MLFVLFLIIMSVTLSRIYLLVSLDFTVLLYLLVHIRP
jgi:hypothetical protein